MVLISKKKCVMIIAGEASGDLHGSRLVKAMQNRHSGLSFYGVGGRAMKAAGVNILIDSSELAVVGITEVFFKIHTILKSMNIIRNALQSLRPALLILIDFPDFNFKVASFAKKFNIPVLYYISPQIWAWRPGRVKKIKKLVDHMAVILPFEKDFYKKRQIPVTFVGHPLLDMDNLELNKKVRTNKTGQSIVGLLPGSRDGEIVRHLPVMIDAAELLKQEIHEIKFIISIAPDIKRKSIDRIFNKYGSTVDYKIEHNCVTTIFKKADLVIAASGTVTLQAAISGTPMIIIYKVSPISYRLGKKLIRVKHIGLVNLIAGRRIVPELIQDGASCENIARKAAEMLKDKNKLEKLGHELSGLKDLLGGPGASERVADIAMGMLGF